MIMLLNILRITENITENIYPKGNKILQET